MHLTSACRQSIDVPGAGIAARFEQGESIWTESSYKYDRDAISRLGRTAGCATRAQWIDNDALFALTLFERQ
jgi:uncharacterized SAM-dependent methyltransferase